MIRDATLSPDRAYRYMLKRVWDEGPLVMFVAVNPSTADEEKDDPTVTRCIDFAGLWGYGGLLLGNVFAYRTTDPVRLKAVADPVGPDNDRHLLAMAERAKAVVFCWGNNGELHRRDRAVVTLLASFEPLCLGLTAQGQPKHPLYLPASTEPVAYPL